MNKATEKKHLKYWITANTFDRGDITKSFETIEECDEWMYVVLKLLLKNF